MAALCKPHNTSKHMLECRAAERNWGGGGGGGGGVGGGAQGKYKKLSL